MIPVLRQKQFNVFVGMDLVEVGNDEITLRLGKQANKRHLQFALQSLVSVFSMYLFLLLYVLFLN